MRVSKYAVTMVCGVVLLMGSTLAAFQGPTTACREMVENLLDSIERFEIISLGNSGSQTPAPIFTEAASGRFTFNTWVDAFDITVSQHNLWGPENGESSAFLGFNEVQQTKPAVLRTFRGSYVKDSLSGYGNSLAMLYIQGADIADDRPGFVSGFLLQDKANPDLEWIFIEPVRPLLKPLVAPYHLFSDYDTEDLDRNCPLSENFHLVYKSSETNFSVPLVPSGVNEVFPQLSGGEPSLSTTQVPLVAIADAAYYDLYTHVIQEIRWWEGQEELVHLVNAFYDTKFANLQLNIRMLKAQTDPGTLGASVRTDPYSRLCNFAQGIPGTHIEHPSNPASDVPGPSAPMVVHLFTGVDLSPMPDDTAVSDSGGGFCEMGCGGFSDIVGLAEGTGGTKFERSNGCTIPFKELDTKEGTKRFPAARHSLSQQVPDLTPKPIPFSCILIPSSCDPRKPGYQATLFQRFLLMTHEVGHNLGAAHFNDESTNIMNSTLSNEMRFRINFMSDFEIRGCLSDGFDYCEHQSGR